MSKRPSVDILIPAFNEAGNIVNTLSQLDEQLSRLPYYFHVIVIDDGSTDGTAAAVTGYEGRLPLTFLALSRNFGKECAILAGIDHARGNAAIIMDADLQHPVEMIPRFLEKWEEGYKSVYGVNANRHKKSTIESLLGRIFYRAINYNADVRIEPNALDFRLIDRCVMDALKQARERVRFTKGLFAWVGFSSIGIPFQPPRRMSGESNFGISSMLRLSSDGLTSFSDLPLRVFIWLGILVSSMATFYGVYEMIRTLFFGADVPGWATLTVAVTFLGGMQLCFLGVIGIYIRNIFEETKQRPMYVVADITECKAGPAVRESRPAAQVIAAGPVRMSS